MLKSVQFGYIFILLENAQKVVEVMFLGERMKWIVGSTFIVYICSLAPTTAVAQFTTQNPSPPRSHSTSSTSYQGSSEFLRYVALETIGSVCKNQVAGSAYASMVANVFPLSNTEFAQPQMSFEHSLDEILNVEFLKQNSIQTYTNQIIHRWRTLEKIFIGNTIYPDTYLKHLNTKLFNQGLSISQQQSIPDQALQNSKDIYLEVQEINKLIGKLNLTCTNRHREYLQLKEILGSKILQDQQLHPEFQKLIYPEGKLQIGDVASHIRTRMKEVLQFGAQESGLFWNLIAQTRIGKLMQPSTPLQSHVGTWQPLACVENGIGIQTLPTDLAQTTNWINQSLQQMRQTSRQILSKLNHDQSKEASDVLTQYIQTSPYAISQTLLANPSFTSAKQICSLILNLKSKNEMKTKVMALINPLLAVFPIGGLSIASGSKGSMIFASIAATVNGFWIYSTVNDLYASIQMENWLKQSLASGLIDPSEGSIMLQNIQQSYPMSALNLALAGVTTTALSMKIANIQKIRSYQRYLDLQGGSSMQAWSKLKFTKPRPFHSAQMDDGIDWPHGTSDFRLPTNGGHGKTSTFSTPSTSTLTRMLDTPRGANAMEGLPTPKASMTHSIVDIPTSTTPTLQSLQSLGVIQSISNQTESNQQPAHQPPQRIHNPNRHRKERAMPPPPPSEPTKPTKNLKNPPLQTNHPLMPQLYTHIYFGDPLPEEQASEDPKKQFQRSKSRLENAIDVLNSNVLDITYHREICFIANTYNNNLGEKARRFIANHGIDCRVYQKLYYDLPSTEGTFEYPEEYLSSLKAIEGLYSKNENDFNLTSQAIDEAFGKTHLTNHYILEELCRLYEEALTPSVHNKVFEYISSHGINCFSKIVIPTPQPIYGTVRKAIAKHFQEFLETQSLEDRDRWRKLLSQTTHKVIYNPNDSPKSTNLLYTMDEIFRLENLKEKNMFFQHVLQSKGEDIYSSRDASDYIEGVVISQGLSKVSSEMAQTIRQSLSTMTSLPVRDEDGRVRSIVFLNMGKRSILTRYLDSIKINDKKVTVRTEIQINWEETKQDVDGYVYIPGHDNFKNNYLFKILNPKYSQIKDAQDFLNDHLNASQMDKLFDLISDQSQKILLTSPHIKSLEYLRNELWRLFYISYDLKNVMVYHPSIDELNKTILDVATNHDGLIESLTNLHASDETIQIIQSTLQDLGFFHNPKQIEQKLFKSIQYFLEEPSSQDLTQSTPFAHLLMQIAQSSASKLDEKMKFELLGIIQDLESSEPEKLLHFFQTLASEVFTTNSATYLKTFIQSNGETIQTQSAHADVIHLQNIYGTNMDPIESSTKETMIRQFNRLAQSKKYLKHLKDSIFSIQLYKPYPRTVYVDFAQARILKSIIWIPVRQKLNDHIIAFLEYNQLSPETFTMIQRPTLDHVADPELNEDRVLDDYQFSRSPKPGRPPFNIDYINQHDINVTKGSNTSHHISMKRMMQVFIEKYKSPRVLFVPADLSLFGVDPSQFIKELNAGRAPTVLTQKTFEGYTSLSNKNLTDYLTQSPGKKYIYVLYSSKVVTALEGRNGRIQNLVPSLQFFKPIMTLESSGNEDIELIFLDQKE